MSCVRYATGDFACDEFDRFFIALDSAITGARVFSILGCIFHFFALLLSIAGSSCTIYISKSNKKQRLFNLAGLLNFLGGICTGIAVSWYFARVLDAYFVYGTAGSFTNFGSTAFGGGERYVAGFCIYLGWVAMVIGVTAGVLMCCSSKDSNLKEDELYEYDGEQEYDPASVIQPTITAAALPPANQGFINDAYYDGQGFEPQPKPQIPTLNTTYVPPPNPVVVENRSRQQLPRATQPRSPSPNRNYRGKDNNVMISNNPKNGQKIGYV